MGAEQTKKPCGARHSGPFVGSVKRYAQLVGSVKRYAQISLQAPENSVSQRQRCPG